MDCKVTFKESSTECAKIRPDLTVHSSKSDFDTWFMVCTGMSSIHCGIPAD